MEELRTLMNYTAAKLPEYPVVMGMKEVGLSLGPSEIGGVTRFNHKGAITAFADVDPGVNESVLLKQNRRMILYMRLLIRGVLRESLAQINVGRNIR